MLVAIRPLCRRGTLMRNANRRSLGGEPPLSKASHRAATLRRVLSVVARRRLRRWALLAVAAVVAFVVFAWLLTADDLNGLLDTQR